MIDSMDIILTLTMYFLYVVLDVFTLFFCVCVCALFDLFEWVGSSKYFFFRKNVS